jgi:two-component system, response regulator RegA
MVDRTNLLIVDADEQHARKLASEMSLRGYQVIVSPGVSGAIAHIRTTPVQYAVIDLKLKDENGLSILFSLSRHRPLSRSVVLTSFASLDSAVAATKLGAIDYLVKPATADQIESALLGLGADERINFSPDAVRLQHIMCVLKMCEGNVSKTAKELKMHRRTRQRVLSKTDLPRGRQRRSALRAVR